MDAALESVRAFLTIADEEYAEKHAVGMLANLTTKGLGGRPKAVERATECCMLLIELEQVEVVLEALLKATLNRIPKLALAATNALLTAVKAFGTPKVIPAGAMLKGLVPLFDAKDAKVRAAAKEITVEMTRWLGSDAVKRDLIDKMRDSMQADVNKAIASVESGACPTRFLRREQAAADVGVSTSGAGPNAESTATTNAARESTQAVAVPDAYDYAEPVSILPLLDQPGEGENPKFWDGVVSKKWQERQYALQTLTKLASAPKLASADYGNVSKSLKQVITKDSNVACIAEAARASAALARGARKDWTRDARALLPGMLDKLKDKTAAVIEALQGALAEYIKHCFELVDVMDDVCLALKHKVPKVQIETLKWLASSFEQIPRAELTALHKAILPPIVKCTSASNGDARNAAFAALASCAKASGGIKTIEFMLMDLDAGKRTKIEEMMTNVESTSATSTLGKPASEASSMRSSVDLRASKSFSSARPAAKTEVVSKLVEAPVQAKSVAAMSVSPQAIEASDDDAAARVTALLGVDTVNGLKSANWKERLEAMSSVQEKAASLGNNSSEALDTMVIGLASFPGWSDSNFQVVGAMFKTIATLSAYESFEFRHAASALDVLGEKLADFKLRVPASDSLMTIAEALGPRAVIARIEEKAGAHKNPKVVAEALNWTGSAVLAFGTECLDTKSLISWARQALETPNPVIKGSGAKLIGALHAGIGPAIKDSLDGLKESQLKSLEAEFARNPFEGGMKPSRTVRTRAVTAATSAEPLAVVASSATAPDAPRVDIGPKITDSFLGKMADSNWKMRAEALEELGTILKAANNSIAPTVGDLPKSLSARFADSNRMLAVTALNLAGEMACAMGPPIEKVGRATLLDIVKYFGDSKKNVREAAIKACTRWAEAMGFGKVIAFLAEKFQELTAKINAEGKKEALDWCAELYNKEENGADDSICTGVLHFAAVGLSDKSTESRKASAVLMQAVMTNIDSAKILSLTSSLKTDLKSAIESYLNKGKATASFKTAGTAVMAANAMKTATTAAQRNAARKAATLGGSAKSTENAVAVPTGPVFLVDTDKAVRIRKYPRKAVKFETLRDEDLMLAYRELKSASQGHFRADIQKMMFTDDIKAHLAALDAIHEAIKSDESELINNFDLLMRWLMLRISEASPNTQVMNKVLDVVLDALHAASDLDYKLAEQEAAILLPVIVEKSGHNIETIREKFRSISRAVPTVYLASKFVGYLTTGIVETKSSRTRSECLEEISRLIERHGLLVCLREDKTLQEVIKLVDTRDISLRNGALNCLASAYKVAGESVWKRIGHIPTELVKDVVTDKFARVAREMSLNNEGSPGDWLKFDPIPIASALDGAAVSKSVDTGVLATSTLTNMMGAASISEEVVNPKKSIVSQSLSALPSRTPFTPRTEPMEVDASAHVVTPAPEDVRIGASTPTVRSLFPDVSAQATSMTWKSLLTAVNDIDENVAVEAMKGVCHEIMNAKDNVALHASMVGDIDALVSSLVKRIEHIFITAIANPSKGTRGCRYVLNALMQIHQERVFATAVTEPTQRAFIKQLILILLDERIMTLADGESLIKAANMLMIAMMENCTRSYTFVAFLTLLYDRPINVPARFDDLLVKCLIKLTRSLQLSIENVHIPTILAGIHGYLSTLGVNAINERAAADDQGLRAVKTLLHEITKHVGSAIYSYCSSIPPRTQLPAPMIYSFIEVNLMAPRSVAPPTGAKSRMNLQSSPGTSIKSKLVTIFKKIGEKTTTSQGLEELYQFTLDHPDEDLTPQLERTSEAFQMYIKRGLQKVEASRMRSSAPTTAPPTATQPSPAAEAKYSVASFRERLAQIEGNVDVDAAPPMSTKVDSSDMSDLERLRQRMNSINARASGTAAP